jgi:deoxyribodipyrimidine photo-lyase
VAGTGSHKPYLFNADNVARYAPQPWHSPGSVIDRSYEETERIARSTSLKPRPLASGLIAKLNPTSEPVLHNAPPIELGVRQPGAEAIAHVAGREVWLVHPWALRSPPPDVPADALVIGVYLREHHDHWPWPLARWNWVDAAMAGVTGQRWWVDAATLAATLAGAARVRSVADPHITRWLHGVAQLDLAPAVFPLVERHCSSFSQWWTRATRGLKNAEELL